MDTETQVMPTEKNQDINIFQKVIGVFTSPAKVFASIADNPTWLIPIILMSVVNLVFILAAEDIILKETLVQQEQAMLDRGMDQAQIEQTMATTAEFMKYFTGPSAVVFPIIILLVVAGVFLFVGNVLLGGSASFKQIFSITAFSWLVLSLSALIILPIVLAKETLLVTFSAAVLMSAEAKTTFLYQLLAKIDIFYIWWVAVYSIGLAAVYKMKTQKTATAVIVVYAIYALVASSITGMFS